MTTRTTTNQPISQMTVAELDALITDVVRRVLREETLTAHPNRNGGTLPTELLATFGAWDDERSAAGVVAEIYANRSLTERDVSL